MVSSSWLSLPSGVSVTTKAHGLNDVQMLKMLTIVIATSFTTTYQILVEEKCNRNDTSFYLRPPWSSPPDCPCRPHCRRPPTNMSLLLSSIYQKYKNNFDVNQYHHSISHPT